MSTHTQRLQDRVAVITGAGSGIGLASARRLAAEGATVVVADVDEETGKLAADEVGGLFVQADVTSEDAVAGLYQLVAETYGGIHVAVNNAGISPPDDDSILTTGLDCLAAGPGGQPHLGLPVLQARDPVHAAAGGRGPARRLHHQHRLVRRGDGRGHLADLLHRLQGRGTGAEPGTGRPVRPGGHPGERAVPGPGEHAAAARAVRHRTRSGPPGAWCTCRWAGSPSRRRSPPRSRSWPATTRRSSPRPRSWWTAASPAPT